MNPLRYSCEFCGVAPQEICRTKDGKPARGTHLPRIRLAMRMDLESAHNAYRSHHYGPYIEDVALEQRAVFGTKISLSQRALTHAINNLAEVLEWIDQWGPESLTEDERETVTDLLYRLDGFTALEHLGEIANRLEKLWGVLPEYDR